MMAYRFEDSRGGECVERHLRPLPAFCRSAGANEGVRLAACFAHVRGRFYELQVNESSYLATQTVTMMAGLCRHPRPGSCNAGSAPRKVRRHPCGALQCPGEGAPRLSGKSKLAEAIRYALSRRIALERFLSDGLIKIASNIVERAIRPEIITRKKCALRGQPWRRPDLGDRRHASAGGEDE